MTMQLTMCLLLALWLIPPAPISPVACFAVLSLVFFTVANSSFASLHDVQGGPAQQDNFQQDLVEAINDNTS